MRIDRSYVGSEREPLMTAFGFKGSALTYLLQSSVALYDGSEVGVGVGVQSVLWSDAKVFAKYGEDRGNALMLMITEYAARAVVGKEFDTPIEANEYLIPICLNYAREIVSDTVSETFVLNALVPIDFALWMLYAKQKGIDNFDGIMGDGARNQRLANIPLITYNTPTSQIVEKAKAGTPIFKIKIGADPDHDADPNKMLKFDMARVEEIHNQLRDIRTDCTECERIVYYLDANGRYDTKERLTDLIEFLDGRGILERTVLFEEPFDEKNEIYVGDLPVSFAADESIHNIADVKKRIDLGYTSITLKSIAKTLSFSLKTEKIARAAGVQCFAADLTVNPVMLEWNICFGARLRALKGMKIGTVESNGAQNYASWDKLRSYLPAGSLDPSGAVYTLDDAFYKSGGIFRVSEHYLNLAKGGKKYE